jgi:hypothetical protein
VFHRPGRTAASKSRRRGFTLLEVLLALFLTSLVLIALAMAIDFQLRVVGMSRADLEEAQLARVLLHRIADDLRAAVPYRPIDYDELTGTASSGSPSAQGSEGSAGDQSMDLGSMGLGDLGLDGLDSELTEDVDVEGLGVMMEMGMPGSIPGIYGGSDWIQIDMGRSPRPEQFPSLLAAAGDVLAVDRLSDVKTVAYFVVSDAQGTTAYAADGTPVGSGLVRRELDRTLASFGAEQGLFDTTQSDVTPIAPEVSAIAFRYFDGLEWLDCWDSASFGALPVAVEIIMTLRPIGEASDGGSDWQTASEADLSDAGSLIYRLVVRLPAAEIDLSSLMSEGILGEAFGETGGTDGQ